MVSELFTDWVFWYVVGGAIVLVAASLLIAILLVARGIEKEAGRALAAARHVQANTVVIWKLADALGLLTQIRDRAEAIADKIELLAGTLHGEAETWRVER